MRFLILVLLLVPTILYANTCDPSRDNLWSSIKCYNKGYNAYNDNIDSQISDEEKEINTLLSEKNHLENIQSSHNSEKQNVEVNLSKVNNEIDYLYSDIESLNKRIGQGMTRISNKIRYIKSIKESIHLTKNSNKIKRDLISNLKLEIESINTEIEIVKDRIRKIPPPSMPEIPLYPPSTPFPESDKPQSPTAQECTRSNLEKMVPFIQKEFGNCKDGILSQLGKVTLDIAHESLNLGKILQIYEETYEEYKRTRSYLKAAYSFLKSTFQRAINILPAVRNGRKYWECDYINFNCPLL